MSLTVDKFAAAIALLVRSGNIKDRLDAAYRQCLSDIDSNDLPRDLRDEFTMLSAALHQVRPASKSEDKLRATIRKMSNQEADRHAETLVRLFGVLARQAGALQMRPSLAVSNALITVTPGSLAESTTAALADDHAKYYRVAAEA
ncbi:MAG: hypothetical protein KDI32_05570 [Pseudomonadales bacterium]|nr:hypothetical protein [Pseudomonadales bacterium]